MGKEIERKFLVKGDAWRSLGKGTSYRQGYLNSVKERTVRIRTINDKAFLTIKGLTVGATRSEYEYEIPLADCNAMLDTLAEKPIIEKKRYKVPFAGLTWEIDEQIVELEGEFKKDILNDYLDALQKEADYLTSDEAVDEAIRANGYTFLANGKREG